MGTKQFQSPLVDPADVTRADSLAREILSEVANKWAFLIVDLLGERTLRFSELRNEIEGISHKMLTQNLRMMERNGLVERTVYPTVPPRVEYTLTEPGRVLRETVHGMCDWTIATSATSRRRVAASMPPRSSDDDHDRCYRCGPSSFHRTRPPSPRTSTPSGHRPGGVREARRGLRQLRLGMSQGVVRRGRGAE